MKLIPNKKVGWVRRGEEKQEIHEHGNKRLSGHIGLGADLIILTRCCPERPEREECISAALPTFWVGLEVF